MLGHLELLGFDGAPKARGLDEQGREALIFIPGVPAWPGNFDAVSSDVGLLKVADIRRSHAAIASFVPAPDLRWNEFMAGAEPAEIVCHNDLAPWNLIPGTDGPVGLLSTGSSPLQGRDCGTLLVPPATSCRCSQISQKTGFNRAGSASWHRHGEIPVNHLMSATVRRARARDQRVRSFGQSG